MAKWTGGLAGIFGLVCVACAGCSDPVDRAAKARIFSPEDPPQVVASASEELPPDQAAQEPRVARRILTMGAAEATERLGSFRYRATVRFRWSEPSSLSLSEERKLEAGSGGVSGDFHAKVDNSRDQGLEVMRAQGRVFARSRYGTLRERKRDRGMSERAREEVFGALGDLVSFFDGRIQLEPRGTVMHEGHSAWRFVVSLAPKGEAADAGVAPELVKLPALAHARGAADDSTERRRSFFARKEPKSLSGEVWVDAEKSVVLKAKLEGTLMIPASTAAPHNATVELALDSLVYDIGRVGPQAVPEFFLPDADKPSGIAEALERFGIRSRDAGVPPDADDDPT
jgi:hypothetical protein